MACQIRLFTKLLLVFLLSIASPAVAQQMVSVSGKEVNLRAGPGTQHDAHWIVSRGYPLQVVERRGNWLKVRDFENDEGWIYRPLTGRTPHLIVKVKIANMRSEPTTRSRIVAKLVYGEVLKTLKHDKGWVRVQREGGLRGWVARRLLWGW
jgi:SH3-like domain-containing protein